MTDRTPIHCSAVDDLAAAYALGAVDSIEEHRISIHLATCSEAHAAARDMIDAAAVLPASLEGVEPPASLRDRVLATATRTPQDHRPPVVAVAPRPAAPTQPAAWWRLSPFPAALAAVALAAAVGFGAWGVGRNAELADRDAALRAIASADAIHPANGEAGSGWVIESGDQALFMAEDLADLGSGELYEFWLIDAEGNAVAAGTLTDTEGVALVTLERDLEGVTTFAVTVETERVEQSANDPVIVSAIGA
jgi:hypothetical protein